MAKFSTFYLFNCWREKWLDLARGRKIDSQERSFFFETGRENSTPISLAVMKQVSHIFHDR